MTEQAQQIFILGGGFGGLYTALALSRLVWQPHAQPNITLVDQRDRFLFSPLLYELLTGELQTWEIAPPFSELLAGTTVQFQQTAVSNIDVHQQTVSFQDGTTHNYDRLVLALGGEAPKANIPGVEEYALPFRTIQDAYQLEERLRQLESSPADKIRVAIVGAGYSGVELACKLADRLGERGRIRLVEMGDEILKRSPDFNREAAQKALSSRKVWIDLETRVAEISADTLSLEYKGQVDTIPVDIVLWATGTRVADVVRSLPVKQNEQGQVVVNSTLQLVDFPNMFAVGDLAESRDIDGQLMPATAQVALQQADYAAWNIWASLTGRPLLPFRYQNLGEMLTLGVDNATLSGLGIKLDGPMAHVVRRLTYLWRMPTLDHQLKVGLNWVTRPLRDVLLNP